MAKTITAKFAGRCTRCNNHFQKGAKITYDRVKRSVVGCPGCAQRGDTPDLVDRAYEDDCAAACGFSPVGGPDQ